MSDKPTATGKTEPADDASAAHRLPYSVEPTRYELNLAPDLDSATFEGSVTIKAVVHEQVDKIELHGAELVIRKSEVIGSDGTVHQAPATLASDSERITLELEGEIAAGGYDIRIEFSGILNDRLHGFYRSTFKDQSGAERTIATTQFEATDARRAFPCFDEPDRKAVFSITLDVPSDLAAYSNSAEVSGEDIGGGKRRVTFADTISMSTYLVAFVVGPLDATEPVDVNGVPVRIIHVPGKSDLTAFALETAAHSLNFFTEWFGIDYPGDKLDLVAIPDFAFGAMENLGCVTFRESALLVDPARASRLEQQRVADVISHEIAHMWFGDLVTMRWWNGIWLNEAFATLMELLCVDAFRPEWQRWVSFGKERDTAMATDALHSTRPVEYPVGPPEEAQGMFDVLTYQKGASVLRMLERYLGPAVFRDGIRKYLETHKYGNTDTVDLWDAIESASGQPVREVMGTWILQGGFPLVEAEPAEGGLKLTQEPFALSSTTGKSAIGSNWQVPVITRSLDDPLTTGTTLLADEALVLSTNPTSVVVNAGGSGFYRVKYSATHVRALASGLSNLVPLERFNVLSDTWAAVVAGHSELEDFFTLTDSLTNENDPDVWSQATGALAFLDHVSPDADRDRLASYARSLLGPVLDRLGWAPVVEEDERIPTLRSAVIGSLGTVGQDADVRERCLALHSDLLSGKAALDPDLAGAVVSVVASAGGEAEFEAFLQLYRNPETPQQEVRYLYALAGFSDPQLSARAFELATTEVRSQNAPFLIQLLVTDRDNGAATWDRVQQHWDTLVERTPANILPRMVDGVRLLCRDKQYAQKVDQFLAEHPLSTGQRTVDQILERLKVNVVFTERLKSSLGPALENRAAS